MCAATVFYKKAGRKYTPVAEYDNELLDALPYGNHLVMVYPGGASRKYNIEPMLAPMIAAGRYAEDVMASSITKSLELRPQLPPITSEQKAAWELLARALGKDEIYLTRSSAYDAARSGLEALQAEVSKTLSNPSVKLAYDEFMLIYKLTKEKDNDYT